MTTLDPFLQLIRQYPPEPSCEPEPLATITYDDHEIDEDRDRIVKNNQDHI